MATSGQQDRMERQGDRALRLLTEEVRSGWITGSSPSGQAPWLTFRAVQGEVALGDLAEDGDVPWETEERTIRFTEVETLDEAEIGEDLNRDGDRFDRYALGTIETVATVDGEEVFTRLTGASSRVILALPSYAGDLNGDGVGDPLFVVNGRVLTISLRLITRTAAGQLLQTVTHSRIRLRNQQE
jgi:hypothetical protein